jgi:histidine ammonia-lyase
MPRRCWTLLQHAQARTVPPEWAAALPRIEAEAAHLDRLLSSDRPPAIYGVNTLVGHLDHIDLPAAEWGPFQMELLRRHALGSAPFYDEHEAACIGYAKAAFLSLGGSAVSPELYRLVCRAVADPAFRPQVPRGCSYSCGDVIPGAHWALALCDFLRDSASYTLRRKEGLALINGAFVHIGLSLSQLGRLHGAWQAFLLASRLGARLCRANVSNYSPALADDPADPVRLFADWMCAASPTEARGRTVQDPVSIRAFPQVAGAVWQALTGYLDVLDQALTRRSDNPLIVQGSDEPLSQASFLAPEITLAAGQVVEAVLLASWMVERRTHHLLSGQVAGIPANAARSATDIGLIQVPKLMTAVLEEARLLAGRRSFASGSSTSYGIEDLWTAGVNTAEVLAEVVERWTRLLAMELTTATLCLADFMPEDRRFAEVLALMPGAGSLPERFDAVRQLIGQQRLPVAKAFSFDGSSPG